MVRRGGSAPPALRLLPPCSERSATRQDWRFRATHSQCRCGDLLVMRVPSDCRAETRGLSRTPRLEANGLTHASPGQHPGNGTHSERALKGRDQIVRPIMCRPFKAGPFFHSFPGRCPGLACRRTFGAETRRSGLIGRCSYSPRTTTMSPGCRPHQTFSP